MSHPVRKQRGKSVACCLALFLHSHSPGNVAATVGVASHLNSCNKDNPSEACAKDQLLVPLQLIKLTVKSTITVCVYDKTPLPVTDMRLKPERAREG